MEQQNEIGTVSDYIKAIEENIKGIDKNQVLVFRGEVEEFEQPCYPNLFRRKILETNPYFEKNQFDEMTANHLTKGRYGKFRGITPGLLPASPFLHS